jgi:hypothetical protein
LATISQEEITALLEQTLSPQTRRMRTTLVFAKEHRAEREVANAFGDLEAWKKTRVYR